MPAQVLQGILLLVTGQQKRQDEVLGAAIAEVSWARDQGSDEGTPALRMIWLQQH